jgi:hypothetical protein
MVQHARQHRLAIALAAVLLAGLPSLSAPVPAQSRPPQYVTTVWQTEQGLPQNSVNAILQDHDGYLWIGTFGGLARFDGERFWVFDSTGTPGFGNNRILSLYESRSGVLWIGTDGGLIRLENGVATTYTDRDGLPSSFITSIRGDAEGNVWIKSSGGVAKFAGAKLEAYPTHRGKAVREFYLQARDGSMWFRCATDLVRFGADGSIATLHVRKPSVFLVQEARDGSVWVAVRDEYRLVRHYQGVFSDVPLPPIGRRALAEDPEYAVTMANGVDGELLLYTPAGLVRIVDGKLSPPEPLSLPANGGELPKVRSLLVDREGNLWVGMVGPGLLRLRPAPLTAYAKDEGLSDSSFNTVFQDREGRIWLGGDFLYWSDGHRFHLFPGVKNILAIAQTGDGDLWFGGYGGLYRWRSGVLSHFKVEAPAVGSIYQDREGTLWIGGTMAERPGGLYRFREEKLDRIPGISGVHSMIGGRDGGFWVAAIEGLFYVRGGQALLYEQNRSLPCNTRDIYQDSTGTLWLATYGGGLLRFRDGRLKAITTKDGLPNNMLLGIQEDGNGNLWVSSNRNIFRLSLKELNDFADGRISSILPVSYGVAEGMRSSECNGGSPGGWKTTDGRIWFPTLRGVVAIDPTAGNLLPPPVVLEEAWANSLTLARDGQTSVPPGNHTFDFRFTALSFSAPEKVRFKYRLEPFDKDWVDAGTRRTAHYTNMAPGNYSFQVAAANNYGIWNEQGASVRFVLQPHFYRTNWFYALCTIFFLALLWVGYRFRMKQLQRKFKRLQDIIETIPGMAWTALPDGNKAFVNRRWAEYTGLSADDTAGSGWTAAVHPDDRQPYGEKWRASLATGEPFEFEARFRCAASGEYRWFLGRGAPLHDEHGKILRWYGILTDIEDRKRAEELLRESETRFRTFMDHVPDAIFVYDFEQRTIFDVNPQACEDLGYTRQELVGTTSLDFHPDLDQAAVEPVTERAAAGETVFDTHWHRRKDGTEFPVEVHTSLFWYGGRRFLLKVARDISDRMRAEEAVRQSEKQLREAIDTIPGYVWSSLPDGSVDFINRRFLEFSGLSFEQALGRGWEAVVHPEDRGHFLEELSAALASGEALETEARLRRADGQYRWLLFRSVPLHDEVGKIVKWYGKSTDIDDRKRAEQALRRSQAHLAEAQRLSHTGSWALDLASDTYVYVSEEDFRIFGFDPNEGSPAREAVFQRIHPEDRDRWKRKFETSLREKLDSFDEYRIVLPEGTVKHVHTIRHLVLNGAGDVVELVGTSMDITERKRAEEERERLRRLEGDLRHLNRVSMMAELAASVAHEVNQPISGVVSNGSACLRWLARDIPDLEEAREAARRIVRDGKRAGEIIARIRALATKKALTRKEELDLNETIREVLALVGDEAKKKSVTIQTQFAGDLSPVSGDRVQLQQVVLNLVMNAIEAMSGVNERPRQLAITTRNIDAEQVQATVEDSGMGIDPQMIDKIFDSFYTTKPGGMGMGLSISRSILQTHAGRLWAAAKDGPGTIFHFTLPKYGEEEPNDGPGKI